MFAICLEASHAKGMGHLFRMLNFKNYLDKQNEKYIFLIKNNDKTKEILKNNNIKFEIVNLDDYKSNWEKDIIEKYNLQYWINDRLNTDKEHSENVVSKGIKLITFDDLGSGAILSNSNICGLFFNEKNLFGKKVLKGTDYLILNNEIDKYKRERNKLNNILVTLGGSDTYGITIKVLKLLKKHNIKATIHIGPSFNHKEELDKELTNDYEVINFIPSLIEEFVKYDLAITGGGVTPFEANASGLPCLIIANELFEIQNGEYLDSIGSSKFLGYHNEIDNKVFSTINDLDLNSMSKNGMKHLDTKGCKRIYKEIKKYE